MKRNSTLTGGRSVKGEHVGRLMEFFSAAFPNVEMSRSQANAILSSLRSLRDVLIMIDRVYHAIIEREDDRAPTYLELSRRINEFIGDVVDYNPRRGKKGRSGIEIAREREVEREKERRAREFINSIDLEERINEITHPDEEEEEQPMEVPEGEAEQENPLERFYVLFAYMCIKKANSNRMEGGDDEEGEEMSSERSQGEHSIMSMFNSMHSSTDEEQQQQQQQEAELDEESAEAIRDEHFRAVALELVSTMFENNEENITNLPTINDQIMAIYRFVRNRYAEDRYLPEAIPDDLMAFVNEYARNNHILLSGADLPLNVSEILNRTQDDRRPIWQFFYNRFVVTDVMDGGTEYVNCLRLRDCIMDACDPQTGQQFIQTEINNAAASRYSSPGYLRAVRRFYDAIVAAFGGGGQNEDWINECHVEVRDGNQVVRLSLSENDRYGYVVIKRMKVVLVAYIAYVMAGAVPGLNNVFYDVYPVPSAGQQVLGGWYRSAGVWDNPTGLFANQCPLNSFVMIVDSVYDGLRKMFFTSPTGDKYDTEWVDGESGDVFVFAPTLGSRGHVPDLILQVIQYGSNVFQPATRWNKKYETLLNRLFPDGGYITVKNTDDDLCFLYMLAVGMVKTKDVGFIRRNERFFEPSTIVSSVLYDSDVDEAKELVNEIMLRNSSEKCKFLEEKVKGLFSLRKFVEVMKEVEDMFVPKDYRIDISVLDPSVSVRLYPVYNSERDGETISFFMIREETNSHFCLITDEKKVYRQTNGKMFQTCSKCHQSFFTQKMMDTHKCKVDGEDKEWHWSDIYDHDESEVVGVCEKCHIKFHDEYELEHHRNHCFMKGRKGSRYIHLPDDCWLCGVEPSESENPVDRVCFADFECCISATTGEHSFMSYGIYDVAKEEFLIGEDLGEFMDLLIAKAKEGKHLKCYFHNAMGYDANFILKYVLNNREKFKDWGMRTIMKSSNRMERLSFMFNTGGERIPNTNPAKYTAKKKHIIEIGDTLHFIGMSLDKIVKSVRKSCCEENLEVFPLFFEEFRKKYPNVAMEEINNILKKNLFPYYFFQTKEDMDCPIEDFSKIFEPKSENLLYFSEAVSVSDLVSNLSQFQHVIEVFECKTARDYHNIYLQCDVMQIADVFLQMRDSFKGVLHVDLHDYMGMPSASWAAFLRFNPSMKLPLYKSVWFQEFFAAGIRGGVTLAPKRYGKATSTMSYIYIDKNGLYPTEMINRLYPCGEFIRRRFDYDVDPFCERRTSAPIFRAGFHDPQKYLMESYFPWLEEHKKGCFISVDLHVTKEVAEKTDQFPMAPEHVRIYDDYFEDEGDQYYEFLQKWSEANGGEMIPPFKGLVATMYDKQEYHVHWRLLKWYIEHGMIVTKLHECVEFDEGDYLKGYVERNVEMRNKYSDPMHKMIWKLPSNALYGKTFENTMNRVSYLIIRNKDTLRALIERATILSISPIDEENCVVRLDGDEVVLDKPTYIGACITEYAKLSMYEAFYDELPKMFKKVEMIYTDTDSFIIGVEHPEGWGAKEIFDHMNKMNPGFLGNKGGQWKSETGDDLIDEVIALRSKVYAYKTKSGKIGKRAKGTTAAAQQKDLDWETYKRALIELRAIPVANVMFNRQGFRISTVEMMKRALSGNDGKRIIEPDGIHTHAIGYDKKMKE